MSEMLSFDAPEGRKVDIVPLTFGRARIAITVPHNRYVYGDVW